MNFVIGCVRDFWHLWVEVYRSPLALPIAVVVMWRAWRRSLSFDLILYSTVPPYFGVRAFADKIPDFLRLQDGIYQDIFKSPWMVPPLLDSVLSWHLERKVMSIRAAGLAFYVFSALLIGRQRHWYLDLLKFTGLLVAVTGLTLGLSIVIMQRTLQWAVPK